jgi:hypothetical protein
MELREYRGHCVVRNMDHGPERKYAGDRVVGQVEVGHRPHLEVKVWVVAPRDGDHLGREIDAECVHAEVVEMVGDVARTAADVDDATATGVAHQLGEQRQACA